MKNIRRICLQALFHISEENEEFSCNALNQAESQINKSPNLLLLSSVEKLYREIFSYRLRNIAGDSLLHAVEEAGDHEHEGIKNMRILMLSLFLVAYKDFT